MWWKVGTGSSLSIFNDAWIVGSINCRLFSPVINSHLVLVEELINNSTRNWKEELIRDTFVVTDAELILRIPLAEEAHKDIVAWSDKPSGEFSIWSTYKLLQTDLANSTPINLQAMNRNLYKKLWDLDLPLKTKIIIWRIIHDFILIEPIYQP